MTIGVLFVCLGNICRSPLAEEVFRDFTKEQKKDHLFHIDSCGTANYHIGNPPDVRAVKTAFTHGLSLNHLGRQFKISDFDQFKYIIAMVKNNQIDLLNQAKPPQHQNQIHTFRKFDPMGDETLDVPDPYYGNITDFEKVYQIVKRSSENLLQFILKNSI
jgi:protein-tyrosine phosphatase